MTGAPTPTWVPGAGLTIETVGGVAPRPSRVAHSEAEPGATRAELGIPAAEGPTTGLIFSSDGLILSSSFHFARDPAVIVVRLADGSRYPARLLGRDDLRRLVMLKIDAEQLPVPTWADQDAIRVGQWAIALGRGFGGPDVCVSVGIVSGLGRMGGNAIQTDAKLSPANYGGPLADLRGRVLGICVPMSYEPGELAGAELYDSGIGFAIGPWAIETIGPRLARGESIVRGILGVSVSPVRGALRIEAVASGSPAESAGMRPGDELVAIDDRAVKGPADLRRVLAFRAAGEAIAVTVRREGKLVHTDATLAAGPPPSTQPAAPGAR